MDEFKAELLDSDDELAEFMFINSMVSNSVVLGPGKHGGSKPGRKKLLAREQVAGHE